MISLKKKGVSMNNRPVYRIVIDTILLLCSVFFIVCSISALYSAMTEQLGALSLLVPLIVGIYASPVLLFGVIFEGIMCAKRGAFAYGIISLCVFTVSYLMLFGTPLLFSIFA